MVHRPALYSLAGLLVVAGLAFFYAHIEPRYRLADQVPDRQQAVAASHRLDAKLTGANPIDVLIEFPKGASLYSPETLGVIAEVHSLIEKQAGVGNVWSLESLRRWLIEAGKPDIATLKSYVAILPEYLTRRFISAGQDAVVVSGRIPDSDASSAPSHRPDAGQIAGRSPCATSRIPNFRDGSFGDRGAQQRQYDRKIKSRLDG